MLIKKTILINILMIKFTFNLIKKEINIRLKIFISRIIKLIDIPDLREEEYPVVSN